MPTSKTTDIQTEVKLMKKSIKLLFGTFVETAVMSFGVSAAFVKNATYLEGTFTDVANSAWYSDSVKNAYEYGIMQGDSEITFSPSISSLVSESESI